MSRTEHVYALYIISTLFCFLTLIYLHLQSYSCLLEAYQRVVRFKTWFHA